MKKLAIAALALLAGCGGSDVQSVPYSVPVHVSNPFPRVSEVMVEANMGYNDDFLSSVAYRVRDPSERGKWLTPDDLEHKLLFQGIVEDSEAFAKAWGNIVDDLPYAGRAYASKSSPCKLVVVTAKRNGTIIVRYHNFFSQKDPAHDSQALLKREEMMNYVHARFGNDAVQKKREFERAIAPYTKAIEDFKSSLAVKFRK